jgi:hypothetical protein
VVKRLFLGAMLCAMSGASTSHAGDGDKPTLSGTWGATAMKESWSTSEWGEDCGPKPTPSGGAPGGTVTVSEAGGELSFSGAGRSFTTAECWEQLPGLKRTSHSASSRGWSNKCASAKGDPRRANVTTSINATDDTIVFAETGVYEWSIKDSVCKASVSRSRSFKLVQRAGEAPVPQPAQAPSAPTAAPTEDKPKDACETPGAPARLEVRPAKKLLRPGESFTLAVRVTDASGCRLGVEPKVRAQSESELAAKLTIDRLRVTAAADAPPGTAPLEVSLASATATVELEVAAADRYDELLQIRGLNEAGEDDRAAVVEIATGLGGAATVAENTARTRKITFIAIVCGVASLLGVAGLAIWRRGRGSRATEDRVTFAAPPPNVTIFETTSPKSLECPRCGRGYPPGTGFCSDDGSALVPSMADAPPSRPSVSGPASAPAGPASPTPAAVAARSAAAPQKICPTCGEFFSGDSSFCGKDGTQLVPVN